LPSMSLLIAARYRRLVARDDSLEPLRRTEESQVTTPALPWTTRLV